MQESIIPETKNAAVAHGLKQAFGTAEFDEIELLTAGMSPARVFRIVVAGHPYLLRVVTRTDHVAGPGQGDQTGHFDSMRMAAEAGLAPRVRYTSSEDGVSITDFVEAIPFPQQEALLRLPGLLRTLHGLPPFPKAVNYLEAVDGFVRRFQAAKILPEIETQELVRGYARVMEVYPRNVDLVSSHNDLKPENILFDGDRVWLVDWEAAFLNDRYFDLAVTANFLVTDDAEEEAYLQRYFGESPGEYRMARFFLMRQIAHMSYAAVFMLLGSRGKAIEPSSTSSDFHDFHARIWAGKISFARDEAKLEYARVHMDRFLQNMRKPRFQDSLRIVHDQASSDNPAHLA